MPTTPGCFFLDSCTLLPQAMKDRTESIVKFLGDPGSDCYISSSVRKEIDDALDGIYNWLQNDIKENFSSFLHQSEKEEITRDDVLLFEPFFEVRRHQLRGKSGYYFQMQEQIEHWLVEYIKTIPHGKRIQLDPFLNLLSTEINKIYEALASKVEIYKEKDISPHPALRTYLFIHGIGQEADQDHLASAIQYQYQNNCWVVFVTFDQNTILRYRNSLFKNCGLHCSKPDYAVHRLRNVVSKGRSPIEFFRDIQNYTKNQIFFAKQLKEVMDIQLIPGN